MKLAQSLSPDNSDRVLFFNKSENGVVAVYANQSAVWLMVNGVLQTAIELNTPYRPLLPHCFVMMLPLLHDKEPARVLELGAGAAALQRYLTFSHPSVAIKSIEHNEIIIEATKTCFPEFAALNIVRDDAYHYVDEMINTSKLFDWVMVDLFYGADSPLLKNTESFVKKLHKLVNDQGWLIINLLTNEKNQLKSITETVAETFAQKTFLFAVPDMQNHILMCKKSGSSIFTFPDEIEVHNLALQI
ncbi:MAG: hypothetical protein HWE10_06985 [Gammaproteobacteria bacterium]|nr:hypothetical protein [Gammaproteobacteria bacterium]